MSLSTVFSLSGNSRPSGDFSRFGSCRLSGNSRRFGDFSRFGNISPSGIFSPSGV
ncbi:hypothetical protein [Streptomyces triticagri]|uniref:hypothetical protein n=1 Tax=Streptomyces triticagri TaxID=2293568 RepID=UPI0013143C0C|nr:hypothetical protein [Streptomyces triticagri]